MARLLSLVALACAASAAELKDIKHVVMLMLENRSFQHYFGTMAGVRGFADPNVQINPDGRSVWYQNLTGVTDEADWLLPYWLNYVGGEENYNKSQCLCAGANNWIPTHEALNGDLNNAWAQIATPQSWGYFKRQDIPVHYALADAFTVGDAYHAAIMSNTDPNRWYWQSGTINVPGGKQSPDEGGVILDDWTTNGCKADGLDCLPLKWPAVAQVLDEAGVDWRSYQESYNWPNTNGLFRFEAFQNAANGSSLYNRGLMFDGENSFDSFKSAAAEGTLPEVSWVFAPQKMHEHSPYTPQDGAYFIHEIAEALFKGKNWENTVFFLNYDEAGGWGDAVMPLIPPNGTAGEWFQDPYEELGYTFAGPGIRIPLIIMSPFTRGGHVFTERADHSSMIMFLEEWLKAKGYKNTTTEELSDWRREHMSNLLSAFDFENPDYSIPKIPKPHHPITNDDDQIIGLYTGFCAIEWTDSCSSDQYISGIPYGNQTEADALFYEDGFKAMRGYVTEGRYVVFESNGHALATGGHHQLEATRSTDEHKGIHQRWVLHAVEQEGSRFRIASAMDGRYLSKARTMTDKEKHAEVYEIEYIGDREYTMKNEQGRYLNIDKRGDVSFEKEPQTYRLFSVTYHD